MNTKLIGYILNVAIIFFAVVAGPYILDFIGVTGGVARMLAIGLIAGGVTLGFEKLGLLPHLRRAQVDKAQADTATGADKAEGDK